MKRITMSQAVRALCAGEQVFFGRGADDRWMWAMSYDGGVPASCPKRVIRRAVAHALSKGESLWVISLA